MLYRVVILYSKSQAQYPRPAEMLRSIHQLLDGHDRSSSFMIHKRTKLNTRLKNVVNA